MHYADVFKSFRKVFLSFELGLRKPERAAFEAIAEAIGMPAVLVCSPADVVTALAAL